MQMVCRFKRGTSQYLGMNDDDDSEQVERSPAGTPDKAQVRLRPYPHIALPTTSLFDPLQC